MVHNIALGRWGVIVIRNWRLRSTVALIVAYVFVLQGFFVYSVANQAGAHAAASGSFYVICSEEEAADQMDVPTETTTHCPACTLSTECTTNAPEAVRLLTLTIERTGFVSIAACISFHLARSGLSRAPPLRHDVIV
jgi:hypothetical protein